MSVVEWAQSHRRSILFLLAMLALVTLVIKTIFEWQEARRAAADRAAEEAFTPVTVGASS